MHQSTFEYLSPTDEQLATMAKLRSCFSAMATDLIHLVPPGLDRDEAVRKLREAAMWSNVAITRLDDGTPRA